jgi:hypothetical protein
MENKDIFVVILTIVAGGFSILASVFNWDFFFENRKAKFFVSILGRNGSRIFYSALGVLLFFLAYKMQTK